MLMRIRFADEFSPGNASSDDDEETIAKEEEMDASDVNDEILALQKESEMDLDDLDFLSDYLKRRDDIVLSEREDDDEEENDRSSRRKNAGTETKAAADVRVYFCARPLKARRRTRITIITHLSFLVWRTEEREQIEERRCEDGAGFRR